MSTDHEIELEELAERHAEEALSTMNRYDRRALLRRGATAGAVLAVAGGYASVAGAARPAPAKRVDYNVELHKIFGPGGKNAGQGFTLHDGMLLAVTGQGSFYGRVMSRGAKLGAGLIQGAGGPKYDISIGDHESGLVPPAVAATRRLASQNKIETLQTSYGAPSEAIVPLIQQYKLLSFNGGGSSPGQLGKDFLWQTRMLFGIDPMPGSLAYLQKRYNATKLAIVGTLENAVEAEKKYAPQVWKQLTNGKGQVVTTEIHEVGATDYGNVIARVKAAKPDVIWTGSFGNDLGYMVKQMREQGVKVPIMGVEFTDQAAKIAGKAFDTFQFGGDYYDAANPNPFNAVLVSAHQRKYRIAPEFYGANYFEHTFIIWDLIRRTIKAGGDPGKSSDLQDQLKANPVFNSVYGGGKGKVGTMKFNLGDHSISKPMGIFVVKGGAPQVIGRIQKVVNLDKATPKDVRAALIEYKAK